MALSMILGLAGAGLNLAGGVGSYYASKANAALARAQGRIDNAVAQANAAALEVQGEYNAAVQRNNAIAVANQKKYENSIIKANRIALAQRSQITREKFLRDVRGAQSELAVRNPGVSQDVLNSIEMEAFSQMADQDIELSLQMQSMGAQLSENTRQAALTTMYGEMQAQNTLQGSRNNAFFTRLSGQNAQASANLRAGQMKLQARSDLIGSFSSSVSSAASYV
jgi:hypothetical protein